MLLQKRNLSGVISIVLQHPEGHLSIGDSRPDRSVTLSADSLRKPEAGKRPRAATSSSWAENRSARAASHLASSTGPVSGQSSCMRSCATRDDTRGTSNGHSSRVGEPPLGDALSEPQGPRAGGGAEAAPGAGGRGPTAPGRPARERRTGGEDPRPSAGSRPNGSRNGESPPTEKNLVSRKVTPLTVARKSRATRSNH